MDTLRIVGTPDDKLNCRVCQSALFGNYEVAAQLGEEVGDQRFGDAGEPVAWTTTCPRCARRYLVTAPLPN